MLFYIRINTINPFFRSNVSTRKKNRFKKPRLKDIGAFVGRKKFNNKDRKKGIPLKFKELYIPQDCADKKSNKYQGNDKGTVNLIKNSRNCI